MNRKASTIASLGALASLGVATLLSGCSATDTIPDLRNTGAGGTRSNGSSGGNASAGTFNNGVAGSSPTTGGSLNGSGGADTSGGSGGAGIGGGSAGDGGSGNNAGTGGSSTGGSNTGGSNTGGSSAGGTDSAGGTNSGGTGGAVGEAGAGGVDNGAGGDSEGGKSAGGSGGKKGGHKGGSGGTSSGGTGGATGGGGSSGSAGSGGSSGMTSLGQFVMTWYSFQDNTPVNSSESASGRELRAYTSVAVPFRLLKDFGGTLNYGDKLYLDYLHGKRMPNGKLHTGWVEIDDFCGDSGDDSYCFQKVGGKSYPNTDLYIGDFSKSGMAPSGGDCSGPAGSGQELTNVSLGNPGSQFELDYGGVSLGSGKCGDYTSAESQQGGLKGGCWDYTPPKSSVSYCVDCVIGVSCTSK